MDGDWITMTKIDRSGTYVFIEFDDGTILRVLEDRAHWITPERLIGPVPESFFDIKWDDEHFFNFFEDENADALWAHGNLSDEDFVAQVNEYDRLCGENEATYSVSDVRHKHGLLWEKSGATYIKLDQEDTSTPIKIIHR